MHRTVGGIAALEPGYRKVLVAPRAGGDLTCARSSLDTPHGTVTVSWKADNGSVAVEAELPDGVTGVLSLPGRADEEIGAGTHRAEYR